MTTHTEPGTGTQWHTYATPPDADDDKPNSMTINGTTWKVGHDYLDAELADVCELRAIVGRSDWTDTRDPDEVPPELVFAYERRDMPDSRVDPNNPDFDGDRFVERYTRPVTNPSAPQPPW